MENKTIPEMTDQELEKRIHDLEETYFCCERNKWESARFTTSLHLGEAKKERVRRRMQA